MSIACIYFPRLGLQLALRQRAVPVGRPLALLAGHGDSALVAVTSAEAASAGVIVGMPAGQARSLCREVTFLPDNTGACLDALDRIAVILRKRTAGDVAVGGRDHLLVALPAPADGPADADRLAALAQAWSGLEARTAVGGSAAAAVAAATCRGRRLRADDDHATDAGALPRHEPLAAELRSNSVLGQLGFRAALRRLADGFGATLEARDESFRSARLIVEGATGPCEARTRPGAAFHHPREVLQGLERHLGADGTDVYRVRLELGDVGPSVKVVPCAASWSWRPGERARDLLRAS